MSDGLDRRQFFKLVGAGSAWVITERMPEVYLADASGYVVVGGDQQTSGEGLAATTLGGTKADSYLPLVTGRAVALAEQKGLPRVASIQNEYNLLYRHYDLDLAELSHHEDVGLLAYSPLAGGILSGKYLGGQKPAGSRGSINGDIGGRLVPQQEAPTRAYVQLSKKHGIDPSAFEVAF